ncbi:hypothetical protein NDU88_006200 [Pleurodeles waltl]|uniref:Uncharacterized protein n=1 Tax=Pleurodeles waltl TaxID=8319 RepID=A0AAV7PK70_PLEWA|nr:hypothetical protein NDU88_006200 [Pleurodeles waltl]
MIRRGTLRAIDQGRAEDCSASSPGRHRGRQLLWARDHGTTLALLPFIHGPPLSPALCRPLAHRGALPGCTVFTADPGSCNKMAAATDAPRGAPEGRDHFLM